jgi:hypothetical protein
MAMATARLASFWPTMCRSSSATTSDGLSACPSSWIVDPAPLPLAPPPLLLLLLLLLLVVVVVGGAGSSPPEPSCSPPEPSSTPLCCANGGDAEYGREPSPQRAPL